MNNKVIALEHVCPDKSELELLKGVKQATTKIVYEGYFHEEPKWRTSGIRPDDKDDGFIFCPYCGMKLPTKEEIEKINI